MTAPPVAPPPVATRPAWRETLRPAAPPDTPPPAADAEDLASTEAALGDALAALRRLSPRHRLGWLLTWPLRRPLLEALAYVQACRAAAGVRARIPGCPPWHAVYLAAERALDRFTA